MFEKTSNPIINHNPGSAAVEAAPEIVYVVMPHGKKLKNLRNIKPLITTLKSAHAAEDATPPSVNAPGLTNSSIVSSPQNSMPQLQTTQSTNTPNNITNPSATPLSGNLPSYSQHSSRALPYLVISLLLVSAVGFVIYKTKAWQYVYPSQEENTSQPTPNTATFPDVTKTKDQTGSEEIIVPQDWVIQNFGQVDCAPTTCGPESDPDGDGLNNLAEFKAHTNPNREDTDSDGLGDRDEVEIFHYDPTTKYSNPSDSKYSDAEYAQGAYDSKTGKTFTTDELKKIQSQIKAQGLNKITLTTLASYLLKTYGVDESSLPSTASPQVKGAFDDTGVPKNLDTSATAKLTRDLARMDTIRKIAVALLGYKEDNKTYPNGEFPDLEDNLKNYLTVATNFTDPINSGAFVYGYAPIASNTGFDLTYFSETQNQLITYTDKQAEIEQVNNVKKNNDAKRMEDLQNIQSALSIYASNKSSDGINLVFPSRSQLEKALIPAYMTALPKDPVTKKMYEYKTSDDATTFTLKVMFELPDAGTTGYLCNQEECRVY